MNGLGKNKEREMFCNKTILRVPAYLACTDGGLTAHPHQANGTLTIANGTLTVG